MLYSLISGRNGEVSQDVELLIEIEKKKIDYTAMATMLFLGWLIWLVFNETQKKIW